MDSSGKFVGVVCDTEDPVEDINDSVEETREEDTVSVTTTVVPEDEEVGQEEVEEEVVEEETVEEEAEEEEAVEEEAMEDEVVEEEAELPGEVVE